MQSLEKEIDYYFRDRVLLDEALTHPSVLYEKKQKSLRHNQRLEFLGDAILELVTTRLLFDHFPKKQEGILTQYRAQLVSTKSLASFAESINLGAHLRLSKGESQSGGAQRESTLADAFEALIGGLYLDGGLPVIHHFLKPLLLPRFSSLKQENLRLNPKGSLQETLQAISPIALEYKVIEELGLDHDKTFTVNAEWNGVLLGEGTGSSKKIAESHAAEDALKKKHWLSEEAT